MRLVLEGVDSKAKQAALGGRHLKMAVHQFSNGVGSSHAQHHVQIIGVDVFGAEDQHIHTNVNSNCTMLHPEAPAGCRKTLQCCVHAWRCPFAILGANWPCKFVCHKPCHVSVTDSHLQMLHALQTTAAANGGRACQYANGYVDTATCTGPTTCQECYMCDITGCIPQPAGTNCSNVVRL